MEVTALKPACPTCRGAGYVVQTQGETAVARVCACQAACPRCEGAGRVYEERDGYQFLRACACQRVRQGVTLHNAAKLPAVLAGRDFDSLKPHFAELEKAKREALDYCARFVPGKTTEGLLFSGPVGTGKTHLLASILRYLTLEARVACRYVEISFLYSEIRNGFSQGRSSLDIIAPLSEVPVLALDELGKGKMSPFEQETIDELISRRYNAGRATLLATNYAVADESRARAPFTSTADRVQEQRAELSLKERVGERVYSRLHQMCRFVVFPPTALDYRKLSARV
jgi:DNA replication protein DnaC